mgnify:CR=1 FL=1
MYITSIGFTLIAWGAGLLLDANIHFGDPQGIFVLAGAAARFGYGTLPVAGN